VPIFVLLFPTQNAAKRQTGLARKNDFDLGEASTSDHRCATRASTCVFISAFARDPSCRCAARPAYGRAVGLSPTFAIEGRRCHAGSPKDLGTFAGEKCRWLRKKKAPTAGWSFLSNSFRRLLDRIKRTLRLCRDSQCNAVHSQSRVAALKVSLAEPRPPSRHPTPHPRRVIGASLCGGDFHSLWIRFSMYAGPERRAHPRDQITTPAVVWRDDPYSIVICTVRDVSPAGAGLLLPDRVGPIPPDFALTFDRVTRHCVAVWQHSGRMGVRFEPT
jgi:hypothetical protein